jgi:hypothetical protein
MALITCPHCQHHPVYDQAEACPKCGGPIRQAAPSPPKSADASATRAERQALLINLLKKHSDLTGLCLHSDPSFTDYPGACVGVFNCALLGELASMAADWIEDIRILDSKVNSHLIRLLRQLPHLKSLAFQFEVDLDDEAFLEISRCTSLRSLSFAIIGGVTTRGYALLTKLTNLELLQLGLIKGPGGRIINYAEQNALLNMLRQQLPNTVVK